MFFPRSPASNAAHIRHSYPAASTQRKLKSNEPSAFAGTGFMSQMLRRVIDAQSSSRLRLLEAWPPRQATSLALAQLFNTPSVEVIHRTKDPDPLLGNALRSAAVVAVSAVALPRPINFLPSDKVSGVTSVWSLAPIGSWSRPRLRVAVNRAIEDCHS